MMSQDDIFDDNDEPSGADDDIIENLEDKYSELEEDEEGSLRRRFPRWVVTAVTLLVLVAFIAISLPDISLILRERFDFLSQNAVLEKEPLVIAARDAVVSITALGIDNLPANSRAGTGFVISDDGRILTNLHVVAGAQQLKVEFENGDVYYSKNYRPLAELDVAVIKIAASKLSFIELASDSLPPLNNTVTIVGNPLGFKRVAARGTINRYVRLQDSGVVMEINLSTRPGSSGSPVINTEGQAVAIVFATLELKENQEVKTLAIPLYLINDELKMRDQQKE